MLINSECLLSRPFFLCAPCAFSLSLLRALPPLSLPLFCAQAVLTLYAQGLLTGVVVDSGDGVTHIVPVYEGFALPQSIRRLDVAGRHLTEYLIKLLLLRGYTFNRTADFEVVREIKEKVCYVGYDLELEKKLALETTTVVQSYTLPDGRVIKVGAERFEAPEALFQPQLLDVEGKGLSDLVFDVINSADINVRPELYKHIVLSGGSTMCPGLLSTREGASRNLPQAGSQGGQGAGGKAQAEDRRPAAAKAYGLPGRLGACGYHEGQGGILDDKGGVRGEGHRGRPCQVLLSGRVEMAREQRWWM